MPPESSAATSAVEPATASASTGGRQRARPDESSTSAPRSDARPSRRSRSRRRRQIRARRVDRLVRHVEPWSVLKISLIFYFCLWVIFMIAGVLLWSAAVGSGTIDNVESFIQELFALETFEFDANQIFRASAVAGLLFVVAGSGFTVLMAVLFNLISDLTGGVRISVVEEETARPMVRRRRTSAGSAKTRSNGRARSGAE